ncbi:MerR family transcriptional regulator [Planomonospora venezuelensis]|uniref:DNA-binding transcriptional MerR regulator n=1 Tax=Planomonospora venezuelensis TaxID=1999 RepID=A0A841DB02_PLAVE|nr:MerR family transcriptional regulator [Planomonospora venezuelensis]MBB5965634.1 DNA-binding transcriptional MerR regulator [Planomonospora venezuelensis]
MRISQLSAASGVPIPTIKYYLREGLLPAGEQTSATRAEYGARHVRRLRLVRALLEVGRLPIAAIRAVLKAVDDETLSMHHVLGTAHYAIAPAIEPHPDAEAWHAARSEADRLIADLGWQVDAHAPTRDELAQVILTLDRLGMPTTGEALRPYAETAMELVTEHEIGTIPLDRTREEAVEALIIGTVVHGRALDVLRRLAQESASARIFGTRAGGADRGPDATP